ncbi:MAG: protoporphyrinogen oxidase [Acidobacteriaceae bacterium]
MKRIAIIGGGISGLAAAYELEKRRQAGTEIDWTLYESSDRLGGTIETTCRDGFILEGGPDGWITEKSWARELALELGLEADLIPSNDATRKTYILLNNQLEPMPARMRMMVPEDLATLEGSTLFTDSARTAYANELKRADELRNTTPTEDESIASFIRRHFGEEVLAKIAAPLLSGVFGGNVENLSVRAVMPAFVTMEREHGSLIAALQAKVKSRGNKPSQPIFTTLRNGVGSLVETLVATLPPERLHLNRSALSLQREGKTWCLRTSKGAAGKSKKHFNNIILATPADTTRALLEPLDPQASTLLPQHSSSAVLTTLAWSADTARTFTIPPGFGFLVPQHSMSPADCHHSNDCHPERSEGPAFRREQHKPSTTPQLLACTFVDQKFPHRAPVGARVIRVFFGGNSTEFFADKSDAEVAATALTQLQKILGPLLAPEPSLTTIRRWPRSLPQYEVGHLDRLAELDTRIAALGNLTLLGNSYRGIGLPDLIHAARTAVRTLE